MSTHKLNLIAERLQHLNPTMADQRLSARWTAPDGTEAVLTALVTEKGNLRVEFTRNLVDESNITATQPADGTILLRFDNKCVKLFDDPPRLRGTWVPDVEQHSDENLMALIDALVEQ